MWKNVEKLLFEIAECQANWTAENFINQQISKIKDTVKGG